MRPWKAGHENGEKVDGLESPQAVHFLGAILTAELANETTQKANDDQILVVWNVGVRILDTAPIHCRFCRPLQVRSERASLSAVPRRVVFFQKRYGKLLCPGCRLFVILGFEIETCGESANV